MKDEKEGSLGESSEEQKTSADWYLQYPEPVVMDPDGWNRKDWKFSWYEEKITLREFEKRRLMSTVRLNAIRPPSPTSEPPEEQEAIYSLNDMLEFGNLCFGFPNTDVKAAFKTWILTRKID